MKDIPLIGTDINEIKKILMRIDKTKTWFLAKKMRTVGALRGVRVRENKRERALYSLVLPNL